MCTKTKLFYQELFSSSVTAIQMLARELNISIIVSHTRLHESSGTGIIRLAPSILVMSGNVALKLWSCSVSRVSTLPVFREATGEILYAEAYNDLLQFMLRNSLATALKARSAEAAIADEDISLPKVFKRTTKERKEELDFRLDRVSK